MKAVVKDKETKEIIVIESEYKTKKDFRKDLNRNGYQVIGRIFDENDKSESQRWYDLGHKF